MTATDILKHEHQIILKVLQAVRGEARLVADYGNLDAPKLDKMLDFFRVFVDRCHQGKEEKHLFPALQKRGVPADAGPLPVLLAEHLGGRNTVMALAAALARAREGDAKAIAAVATNLAIMEEHLRDHINKENLVLFPLADRVLTPEDQETLLAAFDQHEIEEIGVGAHERYHCLAHDLAKG